VSGWRNNAVRDDEIHEIDAHGGWKAQVVDLNRGDAFSEHARSGTSGKTSQINSDVDFTFSQGYNDLIIAHGRSIDGLCDSSAQACTYLALIRRRQRNRDEIDELSVVMLDDTDQGVCDSVVTKVRRDICDTQSTVGEACDRMYVARPWY
jgi:hypothetical protein